MAAACLAGCGGGADQDAAPQPTLPRQLALALASRSDVIARVLDAGDECRALTLAQQLQQQTIAAINSGRIPAAFQEPLQDRVNDLAARIRCVPPAPVVDQGHEAKGKGNGEGKHGHDKGKGKKKGHKGDD